MVEVEGIKIVADKEFSFLFENGKILYTKGIFGGSFAVVAPGVGGSC